MAEVLFYHLTAQSLEEALPRLLAKTLERGWRAVVRVGSEARLRALDDHLWTFAEESFLAHGIAGGGHEAEQPILLTLADERPNGAEVGFAVDRAALPLAAGFARIVVMFDGADGEAVQEARAAWKSLDGAGHTRTYWQHDDTGRWVQRA